MWKISQVFLQELWRNKAVLGYLLLLSLAGWGIFAIESQPQKALLALLQLTQLILPLITLVFASLFYYNSQEFVLLLLAQPIRRQGLIIGMYVALTLVLTLAYWLGIGLPMLIYYPAVESLTLLLAGTLLTAIFAALGLLVATHITDRARGMGLALFLWAFFGFLFDGFLLLIMYHWADYPIERFVLTVAFFNPLDISRILVIMKTEASALLGLSGAIFQSFFGTASGTLLSIGALVAWAVLPCWLSIRYFVNKDI